MRKAVLATILLVASTTGAATIDVRLERGAYKGPLSVQLGLPDEEHEPKWIATRSGDRATFEKLDAAIYVVAVQGAEPAQRLTQKVVVGESDERIVRLTIPARTLTGSFTIGGKPLAGATVLLEHEEWHWTASLVTGADGTLFTSLWDEGLFRVDLRGGPLTAPVKLRSAITGTPVARLTADLPARRIRGIVVDDQNAPVANARVTLRATRHGMTAPIFVATDAKGRFDFPAIEPGKQTLRVTADRFLASALHTVIVKAADEIVEQRIVLDAGRQRALTIVDAAGHAIANATILAVADADILAMTRSDAHGRATIATPKRANGVIWILPPSGSLAVLRADSDATRVVVPEATASLHVDTLLADGTPLPRVSLLLRYNGELMPPEVARLLRNGGNALATNENGRADLARIPAGEYELWPYTTEEEVAGLMASVTERRAPVHVRVAEGPHRATVRFENAIELGAVSRFESCERSSYESASSAHPPGVVAARRDSVVRGLRHLRIQLQLLRSAGRRLALPSRQRLLLRGHGALLHRRSERADSRPGRAVHDRLGRRRCADGCRGSSRASGAQGCGCGDGCFGALT